jgi:hypothetical protein
MARFSVWVLTFSSCLPSLRHEALVACPLASPGASWISSPRHCPLRLQLRVLWRLTPLLEECVFAQRRQRGSYRVLYLVSILVLAQSSAPPWDTCVQGVVHQDTALFDADSWSRRIARVSQYLLSQLAHCKHAHHSVGKSGHEPKGSTVSRRRIVMDPGALTDEGMLVRHVWWRAPPSWSRGLGRE